MTKPRHRHHHPSPAADARTEDAVGADFDLDKDTAHPSERPAGTGFDLVTDIGPDNVPPSLRL